MDITELKTYSSGRRSRSQSPRSAHSHSTAPNDSGRRSPSRRGRSPTRREVPSRTSRPSSTDFKDRIRQLEEEGSRLMAVTSSLGDSLVSGLPKPNFTGSTRPKSPTYSPGSLSALADISAEQQTISELRSRLEQQTKETERFTRDLLGDSAALRLGSSGHESVLSKLEIPTSAPAAGASLPRTSIPGAVGGAYIPGVSAMPGVTGAMLSMGYSQLPRAGSLDYIPMSAADRQLQQARDENVTLQTRLRETYESFEKQRAEFRLTIEELKSRLQEAVIGRDTLVGMKQRESAGQETLIQRLQQTIEQLEKANKTQEETLLEMNSKMETVHKDHYVLESTLNQIRGLLMDQERKRGRPFFEMEPVSRQNASMLVRTIDRCIQELDTELDLKHDKVNKLQSEVKDARVVAEEQIRQAERDNRERLAATRDDLESQLGSTTDRLATAKQQIVNLQDQITMLQQQGEHQVQLKEERLQDLQQRLQAARIEMDEERHQWKIKKDALELAIDQSQKELAAQKADRDEAVRVKAAIETRFNDMQGNIQLLKSEVSTNKEQERKLEKVVQELKMRESELESRVREKESSIQNLELVLQQVRLEADRNLQNTVDSLEREGKEKMACQTTSMEVQLRCMTEQCHKLTRDLEETRDSNTGLSQQVSSLRETESKQKEHIESLQTDRDHVNNMLQDRIADVARLTEERDSYFKMLDDKNQEIESLQTTKEKLSIQLDEREKNFITLQQQNEKMSDLTDSNTKSMVTVKEERDDLMQKLNDKIIEMEEMRHARDALAKKIGKKDKQVKEMEQDNIKMAEDIRDKKTAIERLLQDKDTLFEELKESRYEVATLREDKDQLKKQLEVKKGDLGKEINKLHGKLRAAQHDLKLAQKTLKTREGVDNKAVKVAGKMQKEVTEKRGQIDSLHSKIRWLEDKLEQQSKEKRAMGEEYEKLVNTVQKTAQQNERLSAELKNYLTKNNELREKVSKVEGAIEKAAMKQGAAQAQLEQYEQDIARLKLKHQLELKEISRTGQLKRDADQDPMRSVCLKPVSHAPLHPPSKSQSQPGPANPSRDSKSHIRGRKHEEPDNLKPAQAQMEMLAADSGVVGGELRKLLDEMRSLVYKQQAQELQQMSKKKVEEPDDMSLVSNSNRRSHKRKSRPSAVSKQKPGPRARSVSPVSDLLGTTEIEDIPDNSSSLLSEGSLDSDDDLLHHLQRDERRVVPVEILSSDTQSLCKRLEQKIENLTKMGGHLQQENKEMAKLMKDQDKQLKHVKKQMKT